MENLRYNLYIELAGEGNGWTYLTNDVLIENGMEWTDGFGSISATALLGSPATLQFTLDNSPSNSAGLRGYYSPGHANCRSGFAKKARLLLWVQPDATTVASPTAPTPTLGAEILTNGAFEAPYTAGLANGWTKTGSPTVSQDTANPHGGSSDQKMLKVTSAADTDGVYQTTTPAINTWLIFSGWMRVDAGKEGMFYLRNNASTYLETIYPFGTSWTKYRVTGRADGTAHFYVVKGHTSGTGYAYYADDCSVKPITLSSLFSNSFASTQSLDVSVTVTLSAGTQAGLCLNLDSTGSPANFVLFYLDGTYAWVDKCVAGTYTNLLKVANTNISAVTLRVAKILETYYFYVNGSLIGSASVTDYNIAIQTTHALFSTYSGNTFSNLIYTPFHFQGIWYIKEITPEAGTFEGQTTAVKATCWLDAMMSKKMPLVSIQSAKRADELLNTLRTALGFSLNYWFETGDSTFETAFDADDTKKDSVYNILAKIARSEFGRIYTRQSITYGYVWRFENRNYRAGSTSSLGTISEEMDGVGIVNDAGENYDQVKVNITPRRVDASAVVVARLSYYLALAAGESKTFTIYYTDPNSGNRISASGIVDPPVASTDYKFGTVADGSTEDLNASLTVSLDTVGGNSATVTLTNSGTTAGYVNQFELRGLGIYLYDDYTATAGSDGLRVLNFDMPYQTSPVTAESVANYLQTIVSNLNSYGIGVRFLANKSSNLLAAALLGAPSTRWTIAEAQTGVTGDWFINSRRMTMGLGGRLDVEWQMVPASAESLWILATSALETGTRLGV